MENKKKIDEQLSREPELVRDDIPLESVIVSPDANIKLKDGEYLNLDSFDGVITNKNEIETLKQRQSIDILKNGLLGHFDPINGKYLISDDICYELCQVMKKKQFIKGDALFCTSLSKFTNERKGLDFVVKTSATRGIAISELFVFENINKMAGTVDNTQVHKVGRFSIENKEFYGFGNLNWHNYFEKMYEYFCILDVEYEKAVNEEEAFLLGWIARRKLYLSLIDKISSPVVEDAESNLLLTRIEILSKLGTYGYKVLQKYENIKAGAKKIVKTELTARDQNEMLEEAVESLRGKYEKEQEEYFKKQLPEVKKYTEKINKVKEENENTVKKEIEKKLPQRTVITPSAPSQSAQPKTAGASSPKKDGAKPTAEKDEPKKEEKKEIPKVKGDSPVLPAKPGEIKKGEIPKDAELPKGVELPKILKSGETVITKTPHGEINKEPQPKTPSSLEDKTPNEIVPPKVEDGKGSTEHSLGGAANPYIADASRQPSKGVRALGELRSEIEKIVDGLKKAREGIGNSPEREVPSTPPLSVNPGKRLNEVEYYKKSLAPPETGEIKVTPIVPIGRIVPRGENSSGRIIKTPE